jgi:hypothetical protein
MKYLINVTYYHNKWGGVGKDVYHNPKVKGSNLMGGVLYGQQ